MGGLLCNTESAWVKSEISDWSCSFSWVLNCRTAVSSADCAPQSIPRDPWKCPTGKGVAYWPHNQLRSTVTQSLWARHQPQNDNMQKCPGPPGPYGVKELAPQTWPKHWGILLRAKSIAQQCLPFPSPSLPTKQKAAIDLETNARGSTVSVHHLGLLYVSTFQVPATRLHWWGC